MPTSEARAANRFARSGAMASMATVLIAVLAAGCAAPQYAPRSNDVESVPAPAVPPARPIQISPETAFTSCSSDEYLPRRAANEVRAFFGFFGDQCVGAVPGELVARPVIVGFDEIQGTSPARNAGLQAGDVPITFNGCRVAGIEDLHMRMANFTAGNVAEMVAARRVEHRFVAIKVLIATLPLMGATLKSMHCDSAGLRRTSTFSSSHWVR
jgi:hypothetical protein